VDGKGNVLIGSRSSHLIKKFSPEGRLQAMVACDAWHLAADSSGNFYALADYRTANGENRGLKVVKYDSKGKLLFTLYPELFRSMLGSEGDWPTGIDTDSAGNLYCQFQSKIAKMNSKGEFQGFITCPYFNAKGDTYEFSPTFSAPGTRITVHRYSSSGNELDKTKLMVQKPEMRSGEKLYLTFYEEEASAMALSITKVDDSGNIYLTGVVEGKEPVSMLNDSLRIPGRHVIQKYSPSTKLLTEIQFMAEPMGEFPSYRISRKGDVYQLDYRDDHLDVVRWGLKPATAVKKSSKS
jgi:hypothetical protein